MFKVKNISFIFLLPVTLFNDRQREYNPTIPSIPILSCGKVKLIPPNKGNKLIYSVSIPPPTPQN